MHTLNTYKCIALPTVFTTTTIDNWLDQIKNSPYIDLIQIARSYKRLMVETEDLSLKAKYKKRYDSEKKDLPTVTYNVLFNNYRATENIMSATGLLYIDIDTPTFNIEILDKTKIYAYYKSIGGLGWSILVRVDALNYKNYSSTFESIVSDLGISEYVDRDAKGISQQSVLSYDPDIFINKSSYIFSSSNEISSCTQPLINNQKKEEHIRKDGYEIEKPIRFNNIYDFEFDGDYIFNWNQGFAFIKCYLPNKQLLDKRKRTLLSYLNNLIWLNPDIQYYHALNILDNANREICIEPVPMNVLEGMLKSILKQKNEMKLKPHITIRRILFAPHSCLNVDDKRSICGKLIKERWMMAGCERLQDIITCWDFEAYGKITVANIAEHSDMNKKTIAKYYGYFKDSIIVQANKDYKTALDKGEDVSHNAAVLEFEAA